MVTGRRAAAVVGPVNGAGNLRSRPVGGRRQVRCIIPDQPRISALRVGAPTDARDAPLQGRTTAAPPPARSRIPPRSTNPSARSIGPGDAALWREPACGGGKDLTAELLREARETCHDRPPVAARGPSGTSPQAGATSDRASGAYPEGTAAFVTSVRYTAMKKAVAVTLHGREVRLGRLSGLCTHHPTYLSVASRPSLGAPVPDDPAKRRVPSGNVTSRPFARVDPSSA